MAKLFVDDVGTIILIDMGADISTATSLVLKINKPDATSTTWTPTIYSTRYLKYVAVTNDFNVVGKYTIQPQFTLGTWTGSGQEVYINVYKKF